MLNLKFLFTFLVVTAVSVAPLTGPASLHDAIHTRFFDAGIFVNKKVRVQVHSDAKKPTCANIEISKEKGEIPQKDLDNKSNIALPIVYERLSLKDINYLKHKYNSKNSANRSFRVDSMDSWETPVAK